ADSCMLRGGRTELIVPKPFLLTSFPLESKGKLVGVVLSAPVDVLYPTTFSVELTASNCVWLSALKASIRRSIEARSLNLKRLVSERSQLLIGARLRKLRPDSSDVLPGFGTVKAAVLNCR